MKHKTDPVELVRLYTEEHLTGRQIAAKVGMSNRTVLRRLHQAGVTLRNAGYPIIDKCADRDWLKEQYVSLGKSTTQIATEVGCSNRIVAHWLSRHRIAARPTGSTKGHDRNSTAIARERSSLSHRGLFIGPKNPNWRGGIQVKHPERNRYRNKMWVKAVKDRDGWRCVECGATSDLHAHHIKRWRDYPEHRYDLSNGVTLCHPCHEIAHGHGFKFRFKARQKPTSAPHPIPSGEDIV